MRLDLGSDRCPAAGRLVCKRSPCPGTDRGGILVPAPTGGSQPQAERQGGGPSLRQLSGAGGQVCRTLGGAPEAQRSLPGGPPRSHRLAGRSKAEQNPDGFSYRVYF